MGSIFFALRAKRHRLGLSTYLPTYLEVPTLMKVWVYLAFLSTGSILVLCEISFLSFYSYLSLFYSYMSLPLIQQGNQHPWFSTTPSQHFVANSWIGFLLCYIVVMVIYYTNTWNVSSLSTETLCTRSGFFSL